MKLPICFYCRHFRPTEDGVKCAAFPDEDGIPLAILRGDDRHFDPFPGDHGVRFEPKDEESARFIERAFGRRYEVAVPVSR